MPEIAFGRLEEVPLRAAWKHEAHDFTPWLARNFEALSQAVGIPLELVETEATVDEFSADILARNQMDGTSVLIENQLEGTDHDHLGKILTYLAGLEARSVIWVAAGFREPHLSAIRWLNEHTDDRFAFFAVRARVVRIGNSPLAPVFDVIEQPNGWERQIAQRSRRATAGDSETGQQREAFWRAYLARCPEAAEAGVAVSRLSSAWVEIKGLCAPAMLSLWIGKNGSGVYLRGDRGADYRPLQEQLAPFRDALEARLGARFAGGQSGFLSRQTRLSHTRPEDHPALIDWFERARADYAQAIAECLGGNPGRAVATDAA